MNPVIRFSLLIGEGLSVTGTDGKEYSNASGWLDVTSELSSWDETEITRQRDGLTAVMTEVASPVVFCDGRSLPGDFSAYVLLKRLFEKYGMYAAAKMRVEERDDVDLDAYTVLHEFDLDFQHYEWEDGKVTLDGTSPALQQAIKSRGGTKYDIPVSELSPEPFKYSPIQIQSTATYEIPIEPDFSNDGYGTIRNFLVPFSITHIETETIPNRSLITSTNQGQDFYRNEDASSDKKKFTGQDYFVRNDTDNKEISASPISVAVNIKAKFSVSAGMNVTTINYSQVKLLKFKGTSNESTQTIGTWNVYAGWDASTHVTEVNIDRLATLNAGESLSLVYVAGINITDTESGWSPIFNLYVHTFDELKVTWYQTSNEQITIDAVEPSKLLYALLSRVTGDPQKVSGSIFWGDIGYKPMLAAAESIRGIGEAKFHTSLNDFIDWMETLGYGYEIRGMELAFYKLEMLFHRGDANTTELDEASDVKVEASGDYAYTSLKIGYDKVDYENINGRYEVNGTFEYTTGYTSNEDNELELISPYRADHYGIEFLTWERWNDSTDDQSDNDVFVLACAEAKNDDGQWEFDKSLCFYVSYSLEIKFYNARLCPAFLAQAHSLRLGIIAKDREIAFVSTTSNNKAVFAQLNEDTKEYEVTGGTPYDSFEPSEALFSPFLYKITVGLVESTDIKDYGGIITFECIDETGEPITKKGFLKEASRSVRKEKAEEWTLYAVED